ncbi:MAG: hypothetical protein IT406_04015 [Candidatus Yanofskybacteria bacterium]|nr:hypothetical protein [Candidatus Yanofskybacteria bacterium]
MGKRACSRGKGAAMPKHFSFSSEELRRMHRELCDDVRRATEQEYGSFGTRERTFVARQVWRVLRAVDRRRTRGLVPAFVLSDVYGGALIAYQTGRIQGKSVADARQLAVTFALLPLFKFICEPEDDYRLDRRLLGALTRQWLRR